MFETEFKDNKQDILAEIKIELASRFLGNNGAIRESLKFDIQFSSALELLKNENRYSELLNNKN